MKAAVKVSIAIVLYIIFKKELVKDQLEEIGVC